MHFDKEALGNGLTVFSQVSYGKAGMEIRACLTEDADSHPILRDYMTVEFRVTDQENRVQAVISAAAEETVTVRTILIYPHLWNGVEDPYLYRVSATLLRGEEIVDEAVAYHAVRIFAHQPLRGFCLNEKPYLMKAVRYRLPSQMSGNALYQEQLCGDLRAALELGANTICPEQPCADPCFYQLCDRLGLLVWQEITQENAVPRLSGSTAGSLLSPDRKRKHDLFYYYQACWSEKPFVYLCGHDKFSQSRESARIVAYSNQKKVALYVDGVLFEFKEGAPEFIFEDVPLKSPDTVITAQAGDCYISMTLQRAHRTS